VIAVRPAGHEWGPGDLADPNRRVVTLELTPDEAALLGSRALKIDTTKTPGTPRGESGPGVLGALVVPVTFEDRWGAVAPALRARFPDAEVAEAKARSREPALQDGPAGPDAEGAGFQRTAAELVRSLPKAVTHTGAGLYEVGSGKPYSTIQSALDQLWTDQGPASFTAEQEIRVYAGTYPENLDANNSLTPRADYFLVLRANTGDSVTVEAQSGTSYHFDFNEIEFLWVEGIDFGGAAAHDCGLRCAGATQAEVRNCTFTGFSWYGVQHYSGKIHVADCEFLTGGVHSAAAGVTALGDAHIERCRIRGKYASISVGDYGQWAVEACVADNSDGPALQVNGYSDRSFNFGVISNCTLRATGSGQAAIKFRGPTDACRPCKVRLRNNIIESTSGYGIEFGHGSESSLRQFELDSDYNRFYVSADAKHAYIDGAAKTWAQWQALGYDEHSTSGDPGMTDPANGDYTLTSSSPCRNAGAGAGVGTGENDVAFDDHHPDVGAWSSGEVEAPGRPELTVESVEGSTVTVKVEGDVGVEHHVELVRASTREVADSGSRTGAGTVVLSAPELSALYVVTGWSASAAGRSLPAVPREVFVPVGEAPHEEVRAGVVSRLAAHEVIGSLLGLDGTGRPPIYAAGPGTARRVPSVVCEITGLPDADGNLPGRYLMALRLEALGGGPGANDRLIFAADEALAELPFETTNWSVKRAHRTREETAWEDDGHTEVRRTEWSLLVGRKGG
jgi:hypothetical protein